MPLDWNFYAARLERRHPAGFDAAKLQAFTD
jgi:hypothetical protein